MKKNILMRHLDLFSGIGGFALAARWMGWETVGFAEIDSFASQVLAKHWPGVPNYGDISNVPAGIDADILTAGIPCQPYSCAGKRLGAEDDRAIWPIAFEVIRRVEPSWAVFENVSGFIGLALDGVLSDMEAEGYEVGTVVLPACAVNAPHRRSRVWIVSHHARKLDGENNAGQGKRQIQELGIGDGATSLADPNEAGRREQRRTIAISEKQPAAERRRPCQFCGYEFDHGGLGKYGCPNCCGEGQFEPRMDRDFDGLPSGLDGPEFWDGDWERGIPRVATGIQNRAGRLKALGNAIVPQVAYQIFRAITNHT